MVQIWEMDPYPIGDPRLPHHVYPPKKLTPDELNTRTGAQVWKVNINDPVAMGKRVTTLKKERAFLREDVLILDETTTTNFFEKTELIQLEDLFEEKSEEKELARLVLTGEAYYDVQLDEERWIRILCEAGDLILIPKKKLYRFTTTPKNYVKMKRFFKE